MKKTLQQHIDENKDQIDNPNTGSQRRRHLEDELNSLEKYQIKHPDKDYDPTPLELFCDLNPDALECKIYD